MHKVLLLRWHGITLALTSMLYGLWLLLYPQILASYGTYAILNAMFNSNILPWLFIIMGILKLLGIVMDSKSMRKVAIYAMAFLWLMFGVSFLLVNMQNTVWIFSLSLAIQSFGVAFKEG